MTRLPEDARGSRWSVKMLAWLDPGLLESDDYGPQVELSIPTTTGHSSHWAGLRIERHNGSGVRSTGRQVDQYWFDTARDYLLMEHTRQGDYTGTFERYHEKSITNSVERTPEGTWFPSEVTYVKRFGPVGESRQMVDRKIHDRILLDSGLAPLKHELSP